MYVFIIYYILFLFFKWVFKPKGMLRWGNKKKVFLHDVLEHGGTVCWKDRKQRLIYFYEDKEENKERKPTRALKQRNFAG